MLAPTASSHTRRALSSATPRARHAVTHARLLSERLGTTEATPETLLFGIAQADRTLTIGDNALRGIAGQTLDRFGLTVDNISAAVNKAVDSQVEGVTFDDVELSGCSTRVIDIAFDLGGQQALSADYLLLAIARDPSGRGPEVLRNAGANPHEVAKHLTFELGVVSRYLR